MKRTIILIILVLLLLSVSGIIVLWLENNTGSDVDLIKPKVQTLKIEYGDENVEDLTKQEFLQSKLEDIIKNVSGTYSLSVKLLEDDFEVAIQNDKKYYPASLYKVPLSISILQNIQNGIYSFEDKIKYEKRHQSIGTGIIKDSEIGTYYTVEELLTNLLKHSDNTAQEMLIVKANYNTVNKLFRYDEDIKIDKIVDIFSDLHNQKYLDNKHTEYLIDMLSDTSFDDRINKGLPEDIIFSHKIGNWPDTGTWHDCGIIYGKKDIVVCVMSEGTTYEEFLKVCRDFGLLVTNYFDL